MWSCSEIMWATPGAMHPANMCVWLVPRNQPGAVALQHIRLHAPSLPDYVLCAEQCSLYDVENSGFFPNTIISPATYYYFENAKRNLDYIAIMELIEAGMATLRVEKL